MCSLLLPWDLNQSGAKCHCISEPALSQRGPSWCFPAPEGDRTGLELGWVLGLSLIFFFLYFVAVVGLGVSCTGSVRFSYYRNRLNNMGLVLGGSG